MSEGVTLEGGLFAADLIETLGSDPAGAAGQRPEDFGLPGVRLSDEMQDTFAQVRVQWQRFERRRVAVGDVSTRLTRADWVLPALSFLGFEPTYRRAGIKAGGQSYAVSHTLGEGDDAVPVHVAAWDADLDRRGDARQSPHALVQDYLNRSDALWGIVTNGRRLRILRDTTRLSRPVYVEFDLEGIVSGNQYAAFALMFRMAHRSRFPAGGGPAHDCPLERWYQDGVEQGGRVRGRLRVGVEAALEAFGAGFLEHPKSDKLRDDLASGRLSPEDYYRQLLRLVYRLLFLMVAEERRLLFVDGPAKAERQRLYTRWYAVEHLRGRAASRRGRDPHADLWQGMRATFDLFRQEEAAAELGLGALNGELFAIPSCMHLEGAHVRNDRLLDALFRLSTFEETEGRSRRRRGGRRRVAFAAIDVEELGSVYEGLLDFHPLIDVEARRFTLVSGNERKSTGSYYTPKDLVGELIKSALEPVLAERVKAARTAEDQERAILSLRVIDPACGSGHFLLAAARRMGRELARVRSGESEPSPKDHREAVRDVIRHCVYAVDKNPGAVDLCKVALWIESHSAGLPLTFLDHHVRRGDALVGVMDLGVLADGIPDAAYKPLTGDDKGAASDLKRRNRAEARDALAAYDVGRVLDTFAGRMADLDAMPDDDLADIAAKTARYHAARGQDPAWRRLRRACDLYCAAFFTAKSGAAGRTVPTTGRLVEALAGRLPGQIKAETATLAQDQGFFHWPLEFPEVFRAGGFDVVLGNPPWEVSQLSETEFFDVHDADIAALAGDKRKKAIAALEANRPDLWRKYVEAKRAFDSANEFIRGSDRFKLTAVGKINTYALFAEQFLKLVGERGRAGIIVPTGIATDNSTKAFFDAVAGGRRLAGLYDFENSAPIFQNVHRSYKFALLTLANNVEATRFAFFLTRTDQLADERRRFTLAPDDIALINPNTRTCPIFRTGFDAELTKKIYRRVPVLIDEAEGAAGNPWGMTFRQGLFNMTSDSGLFSTHAKLAAAGGRLEGNAWAMPDGKRMLPLYEAKMIHHYDHRWASYDAAGGGDDVAAAGKADPDFQALPRYWVEAREVEARLKAKGWTRGWLMGWRDICRSTDERTVIAGVVPLVATGDTLLLQFPNVNPEIAAAEIACLDSLPLDYVARQKVGGTHLKYVTFKQLAVLPPSTYIPADLDFITPRVLELTYTAHDMAPFARDLGYDGPPFRWDPDRRAVLRAELDAYYARLYGLERDELRYVLDPKEAMGADWPSETFRVLKNREIKEHGEYRTRRLVLEAWDRFSKDGTFEPERLEREPA